MLETSLSAAALHQFCIHLDIMLELVRAQPQPQMVAEVDICWRKIGLRYRENAVPSLHILMPLQQTCLLQYIHLSKASQKDQSRNCYAVWLSGNDSFWVAWSQENVLPSKFYTNIMYGSVEVVTIPILLSTNPNLRIPASQPHTYTVVVMASNWRRVN